MQYEEDQTFTIIILNRFLGAYFWNFGLAKAKGHRQEIVNSTDKFFTIHKILILMQNFCKSDWF